MSKKVAILQSNYIPWKGYFDLIGAVDVFIFHDDLQYTSNDWRNRNKIKTLKGLEWLTIPCGSSEKRLICEVTIGENKWQRDHWNKILLWYRKAEYFNYYLSFFEDFYINNKWTNLSELNQFLIKYISRDLLGFNTLFEDSRDYNLQGKKAERVKELLIKADADVYLSGPSAKNYLSESFLAEDGIKLEWMDYSNYPEYTQFYPPFDHGVSIIDLLFHMGPNAIKYMKSKNN